ncbi:MAG: hypothetical protein JEZ11_19375 [Desulfobacterales bacterium]|nr:hypothetical protein [Desulfobacterales bacterium]
MKESRVRDILLPYPRGLATAPSVSLDDKVIDAVALMAERGLTEVAVVLNGHAVGCIRIDDAFERLGLCFRQTQQRPGR